MAHQYRPLDLDGMSGSQFLQFYAGDDFDSEHIPVNPEQGIISALAVLHRHVPRSPFPQPNLTLSVESLGETLNVSLWFILVPIDTASPESKKPHNLAKMIHNSLAKNLDGQMYPEDAEFPNPFLQDGDWRWQGDVLSLAELKGAIIEAAKEPGSTYRWRETTSHPDFLRAGGSARTPEKIAAARENAKKAQAALAAKRAAKKAEEAWA
jgi:hypothetical protein